MPGLGGGPPKGVKIEIWLTQFVLMIRKIGKFMQLPFQNPKIKAKLVKF